MAPLLMTASSRLLDMLSTHVDEYSVLMEQERSRRRRSAGHIHRHFSLERLMTSCSALVMVVVGQECPLAFVGRRLMARPQSRTTIRQADKFIIDMLRFSFPARPATVWLSLRNQL